MFLESRGEGVDIGRLDDLMMVKDIKTVGRNGIRFLKADYFDESLYGFRDKVIVKYSLFDLSQIKVYTTDGKYFCTAARVIPVNPLANYIGEPKDIEELKQRLKQQKMLEKQTVQKFLKEFKKEKIAMPFEQDLCIEDKQSIKNAVQQHFESEDETQELIFNNK